MSDVISPATHIIIKGARQHNLKNVNLTLPKGKLIVFTGLSGSGKSSLAFETIYAEGQRKYVESLSSYARQFLGIMQKPDVDQIEGLSPAISIDQKTTSHNPRSTVGTITEIHDYLRLLYARIGHPTCPNCQIEIAPQTIDQIVTNAVSTLERTITAKPTRWYILSPVVRDKKGEFTGLLQNLHKKGYQRVRIDGRVYASDSDVLLIKTNRHSISAIIDRLTLTKKILKNPEERQEFITRLRQSISTALDLSEGLVILSQITDASLEFPTDPRTFEDHLYSQQLACPQCSASFSHIEPRLFSFNTPHGACPTCTGLGHLLKINPDKCLAPDLTISEGAIIPMANTLANDSWFAKRIHAIFEHFEQDPKIPYKQLPPEFQHLLLYGDPKTTYTASGQNQQGRQVSFEFQHEGIIPMLERRYTETTSDYIRLELNRYMQKVTCPDCQGARLKPEALSVFVDQQSIHQVSSLPISQALVWIRHMYQNTSKEDSTLLTPNEAIIARPILREIKERLTFLDSVGLSYLTLHREASTLAGGEAQRIRLASQIGTGLTGVLYVLDEPTIGLHSRDNDRLITTLLRLRNLGNTVIVVEHDEHVIKAADYVVDFGPLAGERGGEVVAVGDNRQFLKADTLTAQYLNHQLTINASSLIRGMKQLSEGLKHPTPRLKSASQSLILTGASHHNLKNITVNFPLNKFIVVTGVSGSGKSTLIHDTLYQALRQRIGLTIDSCGDHQALEGSEHISKVYLIDQSPIGRTPRSNPATYTKAFDLIRTIFASTKEAKALGYTAGRFSFNVKGGRCEACQGGGQVKISMQFLADIYVTCEVCKGTRYNQETLTMYYQGHTISDVLDLTIDQAASLFHNHTKLLKILTTLKAVGLGYLRLGQPAPTLSGGEAQRVKLAKELSVNSPGHTLYVLDEPTTGLHFHDVKNLLTVLKQLVANHNTVIAIEHNLDVIANADHIIDLGPEGGQEGGHLIAQGSPHEISQTKSHTGHYLLAHLQDRDMV